MLKVLDDVRERIERGELSSIAVAMVSREGSTAQVWSKLPSIGTMLGSVSVLHHRLIDKLLD